MNYKFEKQQILELLFKLKNEDLESLKDLYVKQILEWLIKID